MRKYLFTVIIFLFTLFFAFNSNFAEDIDVNEEENEDAAIEELSSENLVDEYTYNLITDILSKISRQLRIIDANFDSARITGEYTRYPMIRLSIDSPYFGLYSITDSRLNIKSAVSTLDMAKGYSIRSIVNTKTLLVQDLGVSDFVISTRKVVISSDMTMEDATIVLEKLIEYLQQARNIEKFTEVQINNIFSDYMSDDKILKIRYIKNELLTISSSLLDVEKNLTKANIITENDMSEDFDKYDEYEKRSLEIKNLIQKTTLTEEDLEKCVTDAISLKNEISQFKEEVNNKYEDDAIINNVLQNTVISMNDYMSYLYDLTEADDEKLESEEDGYLGVINGYISSCNKYRDELSGVLVEGKYNNQELDMDEKDAEKEINKIYDVYLKFLNAYNVALNQYIRINVTDIKSNGIRAYKLSDELVYVYLDLDTELLNVSSSMQKNNMYSNLKSISSLKDIAEKVKSAKVLIED